MRKIEGKYAYEGIAIGEGYFYDNHYNMYSEINNIKIKDVNIEIKRLKEAIEICKVSLLKLREKLDEKTLLEEVKILDSHILLLEDPMYINDIIKEIKENESNSEYSVLKITQKYVSMFEKMENDMYSQRGLDIKETGKRILTALRDNDGDLKKLDGKILVTKELYPVELLRIFKENIQLKGIIMEYGGETSHVAILAKSMKIPTLMGINNIESCIWNKELILDTRKKKSCVLLDFTVEEKIEYEKLKNQLQEFDEKIEKDKNLPAVTKDNKKINLYLNLGDEEKVENVQSVCGVGLLRTEMLYMNSGNFPSEEEQLLFYTKMLEKFDNNQPIIIRTLDIGADKKLKYFDIKEENNPFLGLRGIRLSLRYREIFKEQLKVILKLSKNKSIKIMYPMITNIDELNEANLILNEAKQELLKEKIEYNANIEVGIMVEVPSVIFMAEEFSKKIDFFSIGSNDLTQYLLATDRLSETVANLYDSYNPAVFRAISQLVDCASKYGKKVSVCGEMAGDMIGAVGLMSLGITNLSMIESAIPNIKYLIRKIELEKVKKLKTKILSCSSSKEVREIIENYIENLGVEK